MYYLIIFPWETATTTDIGMDLGMLNNRLQIIANWYVRNTTDMFTNGPTLPAVFGTSVPKGNYADLRTKGWELVASWRDNGQLFNKKFGYGIRLSLGDYQSEITRYNNPTKMLGDYYVGQKLGEIWGYVTDGFFTADNISQAGAQSQIKSSNGGNTMIGDVKFLDLNKDGVINTGANTLSDPGDRRIIGNSQARYSYGAAFDFDWNNFFVSAFFRVWANRTHGQVLKLMLSGDLIIVLITAFHQKWWMRYGRRIIPILIFQDCAVISHRARADP